MQFNLKNFSLVVAGFIFLELVSWIGYNHPFWNEIVFFTIILSMIVLACLRPGLAIVVVLAELIIGSQGGYVFTLGVANINGAILSMRMGLFLVVFGAWLARLLLFVLRKAEIFLKKNRSSKPMEELQWLKFFRESGLLWPYIALLAVFAFSCLQGIRNGNSLGNIFFDANGYAFFALLPAFVEGLQDLKDRSILWITLSAALTASIAESIAVFYFFSHRVYDVAANMYLWVRDTRVGEVTIMTADFHRVFFQSHLFTIAAVFIVLLITSEAKILHRRQFWIPFLFFVWLIVGLLLGLSRSFWFGGLVGTFCLFIFLLWQKRYRHLWKKILVIAPLGLVVAVGAILFIYVFPFPNKTGDVSFASLLGGRALSLTGEAAANSRWALLPELWQAGCRHPFFGSGFGTEVTYQTSDPRLLVDNPTGKYTTYAFEWGYLDLWLKLGLLGSVIYFWFIFTAVKPFFRAIKNGDENSLLIIGLLSGVAAVLATHVFSPYLNHPLGIGVLMLIAALGLGNKINFGQQKTDSLV